MNKDEKLVLLLQMKRKGITMKYIADQLVVSRPLISMWFSGKSGMNQSYVDQLIKIVYGKDIKHFK